VTDFLEQPMMLERHNAAMRRLVAAVQELSLARDVETIRAVVRRAARELVGADGASFVLKEGSLCHYVDEDAIAPLWKGQRFPMSACISGWAMLHQQSAVVPDIYADPRIPADAYRPTFVKSLVMTPIRSQAPIGAIGAYWAHPHDSSPAEVDLLQALADTTAVAMENVAVYTELEQRVRERTEQLEASNRELQAFAWSAAHDLKGPLMLVDAHARVLQHRLETGAAPEICEPRIQEIHAEVRRTTTMIDDLLRLAQYTHADLRRELVDVSAVATSIAAALTDRDRERVVGVDVQPGIRVYADEGLLRVVLQNLLSNAWKFTARCNAARIGVTGRRDDDGATTVMIRDNGIGFEMAQAEGLFAPFRRLHPASEFSGSGVGLATVYRVVHRHGGRVWADAAPGLGATFSFTIPDPTATRNGHPSPPPGSAV
jgi:signal transduction histidine kinase